MNFLTDITCVGLFAGLSLEGTVLIERKDANRDFYGSAVPARDILGGRVPPPEVAGKMYEVCCLSVTVLIASTITLYLACTNKSPTFR
jgi:lipid-binding SYLF domain-containing protein